MRTDSIFYDLFQSFHTLLFELVGLPPETAEGYQFISVEVKEKAFRFDGLFLPDTADKFLWFVEVQFQKRDKFYGELFTEIFIYLNQYQPVQDWRAAVLFPCRQIEPERSIHYEGLFSKVVAVYMDELVENDRSSIGLVNLILSNKEAAIPLAQRLVTNNPLMLEFVETILVYKFKELGREAIQAMFTISDLKQTQFYRETREEALMEGRQEGRQEGWQEGRQEGESRLLMRQLTRRFGQIPSAIASQIPTLPLEQMEELGEALLEFQSIQDLEAWFLT
ncbi:MAG: Rpn family recombination-promoting nuclease/putative transposase [Oscillatoriales cyanobacterium SM2_2_1]|nr:Rpn family recombination-promoting nuclease/putative transposase [Oscillatoriales cyanobacterium SM2_2_1]